MLINSEAMVSITDANQNFSKVARLVDEKGYVVVMKNNVPRYKIIDLQKEEQQTLELAELKEISKRFMSKNREAYEVLAK